MVRNKRPALRPSGRGELRPDNLTQILTVTYDTSALRVDLQVEPDCIILLVAFDEPVVWIGLSVQAVAARRKASDINILVGQAPAIYIAPADREAHRDLQALRRSTAYILRCGRRAGQGKVIRPVVRE